MKKLPTLLISAIISSSPLEFIFAQDAYDHLPDVHAAKVIEEDENSSDDESSSQSGEFISDARTNTLMNDYLLFVDHLEMYTRFSDYSSTSKYRLVYKEVKGVSLEEETEGVPIHLITDISDNPWVDITEVLTSDYSELRVDRYGSRYVVIQTCIVADNKEIDACQHVVWILEVLNS